MSPGRTKRRILLLITAVIVLIFCIPFQIFSQDADTIPVPIFIDGIYTGEISVTILPDESVQVRPSELIAYLEELMSENAIDTAKMIFPQSGWLNLTEMGGLGVRILFKFEDLTIHITIPAHLRRETTISLKGKRQELIGDHITQTNFSVFLNLELWNRFTYETLAYDFSATPEVGLNIFDWVIEARGGIQTNGDLFFWDYARLVKDFPSLKYRLEIGDLTMPVTDLPGVSKLLGASFRKNYKLIPGTDSLSPYSKEIFIREPSKVEIYMNDRKIREKDYQSGSYVFQDFPLTRGINRISIRWEDSEGPHEENILIPFDNSLLNAGEVDLGFAAGLPDRAIQLPVITSYQYLGITDSFTLGITESFNVESLELNIHPDFLFSTSFGNFNLVPRWGMNFNGGQRVNASLTYQMLNYGLQNNINFGAGIDYDFDSVSNPELPISLLSVEGYYNFIFGDGFSFTPEASWGYRFDESRQVLRARAILKKSIRGGSALSANISLNYDEELSFAATISFSSSFPDLNQNIYLVENLETQRLSAFWNKYASEESDFSLNVSTELPMSLDEKISLGLSGGYNHPLFTVSAGHDFDTIIETSEFQNSTYVNASSGFVFADGYFLITKPVNDSFIIVAPGTEFADQILRVNPTSGGSDLELNGKSGVMSNISSFTTHKIYIEPEELAPGMDDAGMKYLATPSYKSAFVITPQADILIFTGGFIKDSEGAPIEAVLGRLTGKNNGESVDFFTDGNGYFEAYSLLPDQYNLQLIGFDQTIIIDLTGIKSGFHDAGTIIIPEDE